jgi:hypothetical protein
MLGTPTKKRRGNSTSPQPYLHVEGGFGTKRMEQETRIQKDKILRKEK